MKHLYRISFTWAIVVLAVICSKFYLQHKELLYKIEQQKLIELHLQNKKVELELMNKLQGNNKQEQVSPKKEVRA